MIWKIEDIFAPVVGKIAWSVRRGHGSFLTMEFGQPHLEVREPIETKAEPGSKAYRILSKRGVAIVGDWHFWVQHAQWSIAVGDERCTFESARADVDKVLELVDGQKLVRVTDSDDLDLQFDLGARIRVRPSRLPDLVGAEQWSLYQRGKVAISALNSGPIIEEPLPPLPSS